MEYYTAMKKHCSARTRMNRTDVMLREKKPGTKEDRLHHRTDVKF